MPKIAIVTGANKGIGLEIARGLAQTAGVHTILACRNTQLGAQAVEELNKDVAEGSTIEQRILDISSSDSIANFVSSFKADFPTCDILVNNAAIAFKNADPTPFAQQASPTISINYLGTVELTKQMLSVLPPGARVDNVASMAGHLKILTNDEIKKEFTSPTLTEEGLSQLMKDFVSDISSERATDKWPKTCYGMSKLGVIAYTRVLARERPDLVVNAVCPGWCATDMSSHSGPRSAEKGAETPLMLAIDPAVTSNGGMYKCVIVIDWISIAAAILPLIMSLSRLPLLV